MTVVGSRRSAESTPELTRFNIGLQRVRARTVRVERLVRAGGKPGVISE